MAKYDRAGVRAFGVNPASAAAHAAYAEQLRLTFPILSDPDLAVARAYGAIRPDGTGVSRSVVLVERDGTVAFAASGAPGADISLEERSGS
jgi:peroxiredoxin